MKIVLKIICVIFIIGSLSSCGNIVDKDSMDAVTKLCEKNGGVKHIMISPMNFNPCIESCQCNDGAIFYRQTILNQTKR